LALEMTQPTSAGLNSIIVCHPMVMMFDRPCQRDETSTIGPGSRYRRTPLTGKSVFSAARVMIHRASVRQIASASNVAHQWRRIVSRGLV